MFTDLPGANRESWGDVPGIGHYGHIQTVNALMLSVERPIYC